MSTSNKTSSILENCPFNSFISNGGIDDLTEISVSVKECAVHTSRIIYGRLRTLTFCWEYSQFSYKCTEVNWSMNTVPVFLATFETSSIEAP